MVRKPLLVLVAASLGSGVRAADVCDGAGEAYVCRVDSDEVFVKMSLPERFLQGVDRTTKFLLPAEGKQVPLPPLFQNVNQHAFHQDFMAQEFPDIFPGLTGREYLNLVERRETRSYWAGVLFRFPGEPDSTYGFDVFTLSGVRAELPELAEIQHIHRVLSPIFTLGVLSYSPRNPEACKKAKGWIDPGLPLNFSFCGVSVGDYVPYTIAKNYGRVRVFATEEEFNEANASGGFGGQDIVVVEIAPADIEGVIAGVCTGSIQSELAHLPIRTALRGTPNAYVKDAVAKFLPWNGELVFLAVEEAGYKIRHATLAEAEPWWREHQPNIGGEIREADIEYRKLDAVGEADLDGPVPPVTRYGGKGANFLRLWTLLPQPHRVPGFVVPFHYYQKFLENNRTRSYADPSREVTFAQYIEELLADPGFRSDSRRRFAELRKLRDLLEDDGVVDPALVRTVAIRVIQVWGTSTKRVRTRSSSNTEDLLEFNGAGLYTSTWACAADDLDVGDDGESRCNVGLPPEVHEPDEQGLARGLKRVWASLWNFRAYEERAYYQIPHLKARMAVLVSEAFPDEQANGVAFTGSPTIRGDRRFLINAQVGDIPVVFTDPRVEAEKDILQMGNGQVVDIIRARRSTEVPEEVYVLSDDHLKEMGAMMALVESKYPVKLGNYQPDQVVLDFEWKLDRHTGRIRFKQVRPFLITTNAKVPEYKLKVPEGLVLCASFMESRHVRKVLELKARCRLRAGDHVVRADGTSGADLIEWLEFSPTGPRLTPLGKGIWTSERTVEPDPGIRFSMSQEFRRGDEPIRVSLVNLFVGNVEGDEIVLDPEALTWAINKYFVHVEFSFPQDPEELLRTTWLLPCELTHLPHIFVDTVFPSGDRVRFEERFQDVLDGTGPAELVRAHVKLAGKEQEITDYWRMSYTAGHHNDTPFPTHWAVLDPAVDVPGVGRVKVVEVNGNFKGEEPTAAFLDENFEVLTDVNWVLFRRQRFDAEEIPQFRRGDANSSGRVNVTDVIVLLRHLYLGGDLACADAADFDDIGSLDLDDAILLLHYLFFSLDPPAAPGPLRCGLDVAPDDLPACVGAGCR